MSTGAIAQISPRHVDRPGRSGETAGPTFGQLPASVAKQSREALPTMTAYELAIKANRRQAEIVYDLFDVVAEYGREVVDRVWVDQVQSAST